MLPKRFWLLKDKVQLTPGDPSEVLTIFSSRLQSYLHQNLVGIYMIGSYAIGGFRKDRSDLDFVVLLNSSMSQDQLTLASTLHQEINSISAKPPLSGIYVLAEDIGKQPSAIQEMAYFHEGVFTTTKNPQSFFEINPVTWIELKLYAKTIYGKASKTLSIETDWADVAAYLYKNINTYWQKWLEGSRNPLHIYYYMTLLCRSENAWCVAGVARQLYTLREQAIVSKRAACMYCLNKLLLTHSDILQDTIHFFERKPSRSPWKQKRDTLRFIEECIRMFNEEYKDQMPGHLKT